MHKSVLEREWQAASTRIDSAHIISCHLRMGKRDEVCGGDIHERFLIATILFRNGTKHQERFGTDSDDLLRFRDWIIANGYSGIAINSTGSF